MEDNERPECSAVNSTVGRRIRCARQDAKLTPTQLGAEIGRSARQIERWEEGVTTVSSGLLYSISKIVDKPIWWFFQDAVLPVELNNDDDLHDECVALLEQLRGSSSLSGIRDLLELAVNTE